MARPSLTDIRSRQILDAFVSCVARYGLHGSTQKLIAEAAGVKRPILRHYLGNKEHMISALVRHVCERYDEQLDWLCASLPTQNRGEAMLKLLYQTPVDYELGLTFQALVIHCSDGEEGAALKSCLERFSEAIARELESQFPCAPAQLRDSVTLTLVSLNIARETLAPFGEPAVWSQRAFLAGCTQLDLLKGHTP